MVIFGAVFLFFTKSTENFEFSRQQNELITIGRQTLEEVTDVLIYAGYMPNGGWDNDGWHPVVLADSIEFEFYADFDGNEVLDDTDYRNIEVIDQRFVITDNGGYVRRIGSNISSLDFNYLDELGNPLTAPLDADDRDLVRHIQISISLTGTWNNQPYTTEVETTINPRNLGMNHNINPAFWPPPDLDGLVVFNVPGTGTDHDPTPDESLMINKLLFWGLSVTILNDEEMATFDFIDEGINLIILRHRDAAGVFPHAALLNSPLEVPVVTLNARDAVDIFSMASVYLEQNYDQMTPANNWHPVNRDLPNLFSIFHVYEPLSSGMQSVLDSLIYNTAGDTVLTYSEGFNYLSGVCVRDEDTDHRRVHFSAYDASEYTDLGGWQMFYNVIRWGIGVPPVYLGDLVEHEDFEDPDDYGGAGPAQISNAYCYVVSEKVTLPPLIDAVDSVILRFYHWFWLASIDYGGYIEISTDSLNWDQIHECDAFFLTAGYNALSGPNFKGGPDVPIFSNQLHLLPNDPGFTLEELNVDSLRGANEQDVWFRFVYGTFVMTPGNRDGWLIDDLSVIHLTGDSTSIHEEQIDTWGDDVRFWEHYEIAPWADCLFYNYVHALDPIFPYEQGYCWTTWGESFYIGPWSHGGFNDTWEIGVTARFWPDPDPQKIPDNGYNYAGNALTIENGFYNPGESSWLLSERYEMAPTIDYEVITLTFLRCVRFVNGDDGWIHLAFSDELTPPDRNDHAQWVEVRRYDGEYQTYWDEQELDVTPQFKINGDGKTYYWIMFTSISGPNFEYGGWNIDNISIYGLDE